MHKLDGRIVVASHNEGKLREIADLIAPFGLEARSAAEFGLPEPDETGTTFEENAYIKAHAAAVATGLPALSDDSGMCADALGGQPGVYTANWAETPDGKRDFGIAMQKVEDLLREKGAVEPKDRTARFVAVICLRLARWRRRILSRRGRGHAGLAAARRARLRLRSGVPAGRS